MVAKVKTIVSEILPGLPILKITQPLIGLTECCVAFKFGKSRI